LDSGETGDGAVEKWQPEVWRRLRICNVSGNNWDCGTIIARSRLASRCVASLLSSSFLLSRREKKTMEEAQPKIICKYDP